MKWYQTITLPGLLAVGLIGAGCNQETYITGIVSQESIRSEPNFFWQDVYRCNVDTAEGLFVLTEVGGDEARDLDALLNPGDKVTIRISDKSKKTKIIRDDYEIIAVEPANKTH